MSERVYLPATTALLAAWYTAGEVPSTDDGYVAPEPGEEGEYAALMAAAADSAALLGEAGGRRVVVVVEGAGTGPVPWREVAAVHADAADRPADADPEDDLAWYATQEVPDLL